MGDPWRRCTRVASSRSMNTSRCRAPAPTARCRGRSASRASWHACQRGPSSTTSPARTCGDSPVTRRSATAAARASVLDTPRPCSVPPEQALPLTMHEVVSGGAVGARTHDPGIMGAHALCAVLTCVDAARAGASGFEYPGLPRTARPAWTRSGGMVAECWDVVAQGVGELVALAGSHGRSGPDLLAWRSISTAEAARASGLRRVGATRAMRREDGARL